MLTKKCLAFLCAVVLFAAVLAAPVSAASASGKTSGAEPNSVGVTATLSATPSAGQASTTPSESVVPSSDITTIVQIECHSIMTGATRSLSSEGRTSAYVYRPDTTYSVWEASSTHIVHSTTWGYWRRELSEVL